MANQRSNYTKMKSNEYQYESGCPPNLILPADQFQSVQPDRKLISKQPASSNNQFRPNNHQLQSDQFQNDPLSGFNSMTSSYSSMNGDNSGDTSPITSGSNAFENLESIISAGHDKGYFPVQHRFQARANVQHHHKQHGDFVSDFGVYKQNGDFQQTDDHQNGYHQNTSHRNADFHQHSAQYYTENYTINIGSDEIFHSENYFHQINNSNTVILEQVNEQYSNNCSDGSRSYSSDNNGRSSPESNKSESKRPFQNSHLGSVKVVKHVPFVETPSTTMKSQLSQDIGDIFEDVDEFIKEHSPVTTPTQSFSPEPMIDQRTLTPESLSPPPVKRKRADDSIEISKQETSGRQETSSIVRKDRRKATNRKASANYRAKQVKRQNFKEEKKVDQERIRKEYELDNHAIKMQIEYMMKTFSQRIKATQNNYI